MSAHPPQHRASPRPHLPERVQLVVWGLGVVVLFLALVAFLTGAQVTERDLSQTGFFGHLYHAIGLFVVGGMDLGLPKSDPLVPGLLLWVVYFAAPGVTVATVVLAFLRTFAERAIVQMPLDHHIVLVGNGRLARAYLDVIEHLESDRQVMVVHPATTTEPLPLNTRSRRHVQGDIREPAVQRPLRLDRAEAVMLLTDDDLHNIEAATAISSTEPRLANRMVVHLADIGLKRLIIGDTDGKGVGASMLFFKMGDADQDARKGSLLAVAPSQLINSHRIAARHMVMHDLLPRFARTEAQDTVIIAGFGSFGQTILELLQREASRRFGTVVVVDEQAGARVRQFTDQVGLHNSAYQLHQVEGDLTDPRTWQTAIEQLGPAADLTATTIIVATSDSSHNIRVGLWLEQHCPGAMLVVRTFGETELTRRLHAQRGLHICDEAKLLSASLSERHRSWFLER